MEKRNEELSQLLANQEELNKSLEEIINYIESIGDKDIYNLSREEQIILMNKVIKKIIINENDDVDVIFKFQRDDNGGLGFGLGNQKDVENGEFSTSAVILMVDSAVLSNFLRPQKQVVSWTEK